MVEAQGAQEHGGRGSVGDHSPGKHSSALPVVPSGHLLPEETEPGKVPTPLHCRPHPSS